MARLAAVALLATTAACASGPPPPPAPAPLAYEQRCADPAVVRCVGFDSVGEVDPFVYPPWGLTEKRGRFVTDVKASGVGSLRFEIPSNTGQDTSGSYARNFSDDLSVQFGEGQEFFVQWRQRFSRELLRTYYADGGGWKQIILGEGDRPGAKTVYSCTQLEIVVQNLYQRGAPGMYHSCGAKDGQFEGLDGAGGRYRPDQWMTFQIQVKVGHWYRNDRRYYRDSIVRLWVADEGQASRLIVNQTGYDLANTVPEARYGKVWLLPYHTGKSAAQRHPIAYTWYDELIISRARIADPV
jgi:hypothetical protein